MRASVKDGLGFDDSAFFELWRLGYFGHCWELYTFWMLVAPCCMVGDEDARLDALNRLDSLAIVHHYCVGRR